MRMLAGLGTAGLGLLVTFGALTGRLPAMLAAVVKPSDLIAPGSQLSPDLELQFSGNNVIDALLKQARAWGLNTNPAWKAEFDSSVRPLIAKALQTSNVHDQDVAAQALRNLNHKYHFAASNATPPGTPIGATT